MNNRKEYCKEYNSRPEEKRKRKLWRRALLILRIKHEKEFHKIYQKLKDENETSRLTSKGVSK